MIKLRVGRDHDSMLQAQSALERFLADNKAGDEATMNAVIIHKEVFGNALRYGEGKEVACRYKCCRDGVVTKYCYRSTAFDPTPRTPDDILAETGRGLWLIHEIADPVTFSIGHHHVRIHSRVALA